MLKTTKQPKVNVKYNEYKVKRLKTTKQHKIKHTNI